MSPELSIFVIVVLAVVGWFALGTHVNIKKGNDVMRWLQSGLPLVGEKTTLRWLGSSVVQLNIEKAHSPFRHVEVLVVLEPRDVPPLWLLSRLRGRRDMLVVRGELTHLPRTCFELLAPDAWTPGNVQREVKDLGWSVLPVAENAFTLHAPQPVVELPQLLATVKSSNLPLMRLSVREQNKRFEIGWRLENFQAVDSRTAFECVHVLARRVS